MPKKKRLSGRDVVKILSSFDFLIVAQKGSHIKLRRIDSRGNRQTLVIPDHAELDKGTLHAIYLQSLRYIPEDELRRYFFNP